MTNQFSQILQSSKEVGSITQVFRSIVYVDGLPGATANEAVVFENGDMGQIMALALGYCEVLLFSRDNLRVGTKVARLGKAMEIGVGEGLLGKILDPSGKPIISKSAIGTSEVRRVDTVPVGLTSRDVVHLPLETGFSVVDLLVPLGIGQRELVVGDRKTGKSTFMQGVMYTQALAGSICVYAVIGKRNIDLKKVVDFTIEKKINSQTVIVGSTATDSAGMVFLTPYTAMTIAEYFRDQGKNVLLVLDDLTTHAQYYREISLQARRFPGRSSYPGDIFYIHSKLLERAGSFKKGTITVLPGAESIMGDLSGYIQTNLMAITDGHLFFDTDVFNEGRRPAINPYLSVTRVGQQAQTALLKDLSRQLSRFLVHYQRLKDLVHFGTEFEERVRKDLALGDRIFSFFNQSIDTLVPVNVSILMVGALWNGAWSDTTDDKLHQDMTRIAGFYRQDKSFKDRCDRIIRTAKTFQSLIVAMRDQPDLLVTTKNG